jgi:toxin secretion/phage lysis holin
MKIFDMWPLKMIISSILMMFTPFKQALLVLLIIIIIDTLTGVYYSVKYKKFSSKGFRKGIKKLITYFIAVAVVRLFEIGISELINTNMYTTFILSYLIVTETTSVLENLTLLGVPIPYQFISKIIKLIKLKLFKGLLDEESSNQDYINEIDDMIKYQVPNIKSENIRKLIVIKFEEWKSTINIIGLQLSSNVENGDIIFYKVTGLINNTRALMEEKWLDSEIPKVCIINFKLWHQSRIEKWTKEVEAICKSSDTAENKYKMIMDKIVILLYQTIIDVQKGENTPSNC